MISEHFPPLEGVHLCDLMVHVHMISKSGSAFIYLFIFKVEFPVASANTTLLLRLWFSPGYRGSSRIAAGVAAL